MLKFFPETPKKGR